MTDSPIFSKLANDPDFNDLVIAFVADLPNRTDRILTLIGSGTLDEAADALHQLKGSSGIFGFQPIHLLAKELEKMVRNSDPTIEEKAHELERLCQRASADRN
ncbi:MAG: Hpt domain-containing protein [Planctomycetota bacterium]|nr:Hpt domain-containing protein [Planctomycetota bacterium]